MPSFSSIPPEVASLTGGNPLLTALYLDNNIYSAEEIDQLAIHLQRSTSPFELPNLQKGIDRVLQAIQDDEQIAVWGDFDVDGQTATTILVGGLRELGAKVKYHIPIRSTESHGINIPNLNILLEQKTNLLITCDTGIQELAAVQLCQAAGVDVIITDHHTPAEKLPDALAVISGQLLPSSHNLHDLCGAGCAYKFIEALFIAAGFPEKKDFFIDLAAVGTIADLVPLTLENRRIVRKGLKKLREDPRLAFQELLLLAEIPPSTLQEDHIAFQIAPRLNALGRLDDPNPIVSFFLSEDITDIRIMANRLDGLNEKRKQMCDTIFRAAAAELKREPAKLREPVLILHHPAWPGGINGLVASQLTERYHKPSIVLTAPEDGLARGSARSIEGINITEAIGSQVELLSGYGGHAMAAGLSLPTDKLPLFSRGISDYLKRTTQGQNIESTVRVTNEIAFSDLSIHVLEKIDLFSPFGPSNPAPIFLTSVIQIEKIVPLSREKQHLKLLCKDRNGTELTIFWWNGEADLLPLDQNLDILYNARVASFRGEIHVQCTLVDLRIHPTDSAEKISKDIIFKDLRMEKMPLERLDEMIKQEHHQAWSEGIPELAGITSTRNFLITSQSLIVVGAPCNFKILHQVLDRVKPKEIILISYPVSFDQPAALIQCCLGFCKYAVEHKQGWIQYRALEEYFGHCNLTIKTVFNFLQQKGTLSILEETPTDIRISLSGRQTSNKNEQNHQKLVNQIAETVSFRKYFQNAPIEVISKALSEK
jgi:single-stranded-DNA-specific exonuclease